MKLGQPMLLAGPAIGAVLALIVVPVAYVLIRPILIGDLAGTWEYLGEVGAPTAFLRGIEYATTSLALQLAVGCLLAYCVWRNGAGSALTTVFVLPYFISTMCAVLVFKLLLDPSHGVLAAFGGGISTSSLFTSEGVFWLVVLVSVWQFYPFVFLSALSGLRSISTEAVDGVMLDGGGILGLMRHVLWPRLRLVLLATAVLRALWMFTKVDTVYLIAGDSMLRESVETAPVLAYRLAFHSGMTSAASLICGLLVLSLLPIPLMGGRLGLTATVSR